MLTLHYAAISMFISFGECDHGPKFIIYTVNSFHWSMFFPLSVMCDPFALITHLFGDLREKIILILFALLCLATLSRQYHNQILLPNKLPFLWYKYTQWAHCQTTLKQRCIDVTDVDTTLFRCRLTMTCPLGNFCLPKFIKQTRQLRKQTNKSIGLS